MYADLCIPPIHKIQPRKYNSIETIIAAYNPLQL